MIERKTRFDAWGEDLPEEKRWELYRLTKPPREGEDEHRVVLRTYEEAKAYIADSLRLSAPSRPGWYRFLARMRAEEQKRLVYRVAGSADTASDMAAEVRIDNAKAGEAFRALAVDAGMDGNDETAHLYAGVANMFLGLAQNDAALALKDRAQSVKEAELKIALKKLEMLEAEKSKATAALGDAKLTTEDKLAKMREIFG